MLGATDVYIICMKCFYILMVVPFLLWGSAIPNFSAMHTSKDVVVFLSTPRSGSNLVSGSLSAITRKPIGWLHWKGGFYDHAKTSHPSYNRAGVPLVSRLPLVYRTHHFQSNIVQLRTDWNKLIFLTRNPKELLYRRVARSKEKPSNQEIEQFFNYYLTTFEGYDSWDEDNKMLVFYEDFIQNGDEILLNILSFIGEEPVFFNDYIEHKEEYLQRMLQSYQEQHGIETAGISSQNGPKAIHYTASVPVEDLQALDRYIEQRAPHLWNNYLKRFATYQ